MSYEMLMNIINDSKTLYDKSFYNAVYLGLFMVLILKFIMSNNDLYLRKNDRIINN